jgi:hypothetical protein
MVFEGYIGCDLLDLSYIEGGRLAGFAILELDINR